MGEVVGNFVQDGRFGWSFVPAKVHLKCIRVAHPHEGASKNPKFRVPMELNYPAGGAFGRHNKLGPVNSLAPVCPNLGRNVGIAVDNVVHFMYSETLLREINALLDTFKCHIQHLFELLYTCLSNESIGFRALQ